MRKMAVGLLNFLKKLIYRYWIGPLEARLYTMAGAGRGTFSYGLMIALEWLKDFGRLICSGYRVDAKRWEGSEWSVLYVCDSTSDSKEELKYLLMDKNPKEIPLGRHFTWKLKKLIRRHCEMKCLVVLDLNRLIKIRYPSKLNVRIPAWIRTILDLSGTPEDILQRMTQARRRDIRMLAYESYEFSATRKSVDVEFFHDHMYMPYARQRFGNRAITYTFDSPPEATESDGILLTVRKNGELIAGTLGSPRRCGNTFSAIHLGKMENMEISKRGSAGIALFWHIISWAHKNGFEKVDFGGTRARLHDGIFGFKREWGMKVFRNATDRTRWTFLADSLPLSLIQRMNELAFITQTGKGFRGLFLNSTGTPLADKKKGRLNKISRKASLQDLLVINMPD